MLADEITRQVTVTSKLPPVEGVSPVRTVVMVGAQPYAAWDLGRMLGLGPLAASWVLARIPFLGGVVPMALRTGPCLAVQALSGSTPLPLGTFRARRQALARAFLAADVGVELKDAPVGTLLSLAKLWTPSEVEISASAVSEIEGGGAAQSLSASAGAQPTGGKVPVVPAPASHASGGAVRRGEVR